LWIGLHVHDGETVTTVVDYLVNLNQFNFQV